jgi:hypothetical protein
MPRKPKPQPDNPEQFKRFIDMAREVEAVETPDALDKAFDRVIARSQREVREKEPLDRTAASRKRRKG